MYDIYVYIMYIYRVFQIPEAYFFPRQRHGSFRPDPPVGASSHHEIHTPGPIRPQRHPLPAPLAAAKVWGRKTWVKHGHFDHPIGNCNHTTL